MGKRCGAGEPCGPPLRKAEGCRGRQGRNPRAPGTHLRPEAGGGEQVPGIRPPQAPPLSPRPRPLGPPPPARRLTGFASRITAATWSGGSRGEGAPRGDRGAGLVWFLWFRFPGLPRERGHTETALHESLPPPRLGLRQASADRPAAPLPPAAGQSAPAPPRPRKLARPQRLAPPPPLPSGLSGRDVTHGLVRRAAAGAPVRPPSQC